MWFHIVGFGEGRIVKHILVKVSGEATSISDPKTQSLTHHWLGRWNFTSNGQSQIVYFFVNI